MATNKTPAEIIKDMAALTEAMIKIRKEIEEVSIPQKTITSKRSNERYAG